MDVFEFLHRDHEEIREILRRFAEHDEGDPEQRELFHDLRSALEMHTDLEQLFFYPVLQQHDATRALAGDSLAGHAALGELVDDLAHTDVADEEWPAKLEALKKSFEHHADDEEAQLFAKARVLIDPKQASLLGAAIAERKLDPSSRETRALRTPPQP